MHALDALCVGELAGVEAGSLRTLRVSAQGRGRYGRTLVNDSGFPRGYLMRQKRVRGFQTGDLVRAEVPSQLKTRGVHTGRVAVRASGSFRVGKVDGINAKYCRLLQSCHGYSYGLVEVQAAEMPPRQPSKRSASFLAMLEKQGYPEAVV